MERDLKREHEILDNGYDAVRTMARDMVQNGATLADILFHANQMWHEFRVGAFTAGLYDVSQTGMYMKNFDALKTDKIIRADKRYAAGLDSQRFKDFAD
jgi:cobalamin-dependent methionine synthase I